jgi:hypothetical protein
VYDYTYGIRHEGSAETNSASPKRAFRTEFFAHRNFFATPRSASGEKCFTYEEVSTIFANAIRAYGKRHKDFMTDEKIIAEFIEHSEG